MCSNAAGNAARPHCTIMNPIWATVDQASVRFTLTCAHIASMPRTAVIVPTAESSSNASGTRTISGANRNSNAPPALMTPACIRAETGVGASIVSGSQLWNGNWADLVSAATATSRATAVAEGPTGSAVAAAVNARMSNVPHSRHARTAAATRATSPSRLMRNFFRAGFQASTRPG
jgi:hypothetical protein